jgi:hypothetical protein
VLATIVLVSLNDTRESARINKTAQEVRSLINIFESFDIDTYSPPARCRVQNNCDSSSDPLINDLGVASWNGPYIAGGVYKRKHAWGGHVGIENSDYDSDGLLETFLVLDDDPPGGSPPNSGQIPNAALQEIDEKIDDGNLATGRFMTNVPGVSTGAGSAVYLMIDP